MGRIAMPESAVMVPMDRSRVLVGCDVPTNLLMSRAPDVCFKMIRGKLRKFTSNVVIGGGASSGPLAMLGLQRFAGLRSLVVVSKCMSISSHVVSCWFVSASSEVGCCQYK